MQPKNKAKIYGIVLVLGLAGLIVESLGGTSGPPLWWLLSLRVVGGAMSVSGGFGLLLLWAQPKEGTATPQASLVQLPEIGQTKSQSSQQGDGHEPISHG